MNPGHKTPECDGNWIDISTLAQRKVMCVKCRATLPIGLDATEDLPLASRPGEIRVVQPDDNEGYAGADPDFWYPLTAIFVVACLLSGFLGFLLGRLQ